MRGTLAIVAMLVAQDAMDGASRVHPVFRARVRALSNSFAFDDNSGMVGHSG